MIRVLAVILLLSGCATMESERRESSAGYAEWRCEERWGWIHVREDFVHDAITWHHEIVHLEQMRRYGCERFAELQKDTAFARQMEEEAVHESLRRSRS